MVGPVSVMSTVNKIGKYLLVLILLMNFVGIVTAVAPVTGTSSIIVAMSNLCVTARNLLAIGTMLMVILAAATYAVGQILGAETRARASVWATAMMTGAVIGIVIYMVVPWVIASMMGGAPSNNPCSFTIT
jgi:hypothetical protein